MGKVTLHADDKLVKCRICHQPTRFKSQVCMGCTPLVSCKRHEGSDKNFVSFWETNNPYNKWTVKILDQKRPGH